MNPDDDLDLIERTLNDEETEMGNIENPGEFEGYEGEPSVECRTIMDEYVDHWNSFKRSLDALDQGVKGNRSCRDLASDQKIHVVNMKASVMLMDVKSDSVSARKCKGLSISELKEYVELSRSMVRYTKAKIPSIRARFEDCGIVAKRSVAVVSPKQDTNKNEIVNNMEKCKVNTVDKRVDIMPSGLVNYVEFITVGSEKFKIESDQAHLGSTPGFSLKSFDHGWSDVNFFVTRSVNDSFKSVKAASAAIDPYVEKIRRFATKFSGCD